MYLEVKQVEGSCPCCSKPVGLAPVMDVRSMFAAPCQALHDVYGHSVVMAGVYFHIRCGESKRLLMCAMTAHGQVIHITAKPP